MGRVAQPGVARANIAVSKECPDGTPSHRATFKDYSVLQQHILFWDRDNDGIIWPRHTYSGFRRLGFNILFSLFAVMVIHGGFSYPTRFEFSWLPDPFFRVYVQSIHKAKHASDSMVYDHEGRFTPQNFENQFSKYGDSREGTLTLRQIFNLMQGNRCAIDPYGWWAALFEWGTTWLLLQRGGKVHKEDLRRLYDGSIFWKIEEERNSKAGWSQGWGLGGDGFWGSEKRTLALRLMAITKHVIRLVRWSLLLATLSVVLLYAYDRLITPLIPHELPQAKVLQSAWYPRQCSHDGPVYRPNSTKEVAAVIQNGLRDCPIALGERVGSNDLSVRASRQMYHSSSEFPCVNFRAGSCAIQLEMSRMNRVISWDTEALTITVEPSLQMNHLMDAMHDLGMSADYHYIPIYTGLTVGGMFLTGAHGSSIEKPSAFGHTVSRIEYIDSHGEVVEESDPTDWIGSMGMFGVVTQMTIRGVPQYKLNTTVVKENDSGLAERIATYFQDPSFSRVMWYPNAHTSIVRWHSAAPVDTPGEAYHGFFEHRPWAAVGGKFALILDQINFTPIPTDWGICLFEKHIPPFWYKEGSTGHWLGFNESVYGWPHKLGGSSCDGSQLGCYWQNQVQILVEFDMDVRFLGDWIREVRRIADSIRYRGCLPSLLGFAMRFGKASSAPLDMAYGRDTVYIDMLVAKGLTSLPAHHQDVLAEIELMSFCKYKARPHWGKNPERAFLNRRCPIRPKYPAFDNFLDKARSVDPRRMFEPPLFRRVVDGEDTNSYPGCAAQLDCYCTEDEHCGPWPLYKCVKSVHSSDFNVCRKRINHLAE